MLGAQGRPDGFCWWIDSVGGFRAFSRDRIQIGNIANKRNHVAVMGDLSAQHAELLREQQGWVLIAHAETSVNGRSGTSFLLKDGDEIAMRAVKWAFRQPMSWSKTARLELVGRHRLPMGLDGVVLLSETCALSNRRDAHIPAPWDTPVVVTWQRNAYWLRGPGELVIDGKKYAGWGPLSPMSEVRGEWGSFRWEPGNVGSDSSIGGA